MDATYCPECGQGDDVLHLATCSKDPGGKTTEHVPGRYEAIGDPEEESRLRARIAVLGIENAKLNARLSNIMVSLAHLDTGIDRLAERVRASRSCLSDLGEEWNAEDRKRIVTLEAEIATREEREQKLVNSNLELKAEIQRLRGNDIAHDRARDRAYI